VFLFTTQYDPDIAFKFTVEELSACIDKRIERRRRTKKLSHLHPQETLKYLNALKIRLSRVAKKLANAPNNDALSWKFLTDEAETGLEHFVIYLLEAGCGSVRCPECQSHYHAKSLTTYTFRSWDVIGVGVDCPLNHGLMSIVTAIAEFTGTPDANGRWKRETDV
jgi:hypothetical protein